MACSQRMTVGPCDPQTLIKDARPVSSLSIGRTARAWRTGSMRLMAARPRLRVSGPRS